MSKDLEQRMAALEADVAAIKRLRMVSVNLAVQKTEDEVNGKLMRPASDKAAQARQDK